jgi:hypothetical protein
MPHSIYRFGDIRIDPSARELRNGGALATLSPKVFDCLIYLIEHRERAVGRDELIGWRLRTVADKLCGGSMTPLLTHLVQSRPLKKRDLDELRSLIDRLDKPPSRNKRK